MKRTLNSPRVLSSMAAVALLGLVVGSPAWGDLFGTYTVSPGNSTNSNHNAATYAVVKNLGNNAILVFVQYSGTDKGSFVCESADWDAKLDAYSCEKPKPDDPNIMETVTIGTIGGKFCENLRDDPLRGGDTILTLANCYDEGVKCACYEITHEPRNPASDVDPSMLMGPPGAGAGTGKDN